MPSSTSHYWKLGGEGEGGGARDDATSASAYAGWGTVTTTTAHNVMLTSTLSCCEILYHLVMRAQKDVFSMRM